jgi:hypothetical protein
MRQFRSARAVRANVPLLLALIGPSGGGKTYSAHRLARGIQRVQPGPIFGIDTEGQRMAELADRFEFDRVPFAPPFGSLDYMAAIQHCVERGAKTIIIDSMSHEHEGPGGMLDAADQIVEEKIRRKVEHGDLASPDDWKADKERQKLKLGSYIKPKSERQKLIQYILQIPCNVIMCFRSKEKIKPVAGKEPEHLGWMPIGGDEYWYEMTARCLLLPGANGAPTWSASGDGEKLAMRLPEQFKDVLKGQLSEDMGERMARWAVGTVSKPFAEVLELVAAAVTADEAKKVANELRNSSWTKEQRDSVRSAIEAKAGAVPAENGEKEDGKKQ